MSKEKEKREVVIDIPEQITVLIEAAKVKTLPHALLFWGPLPQEEKDFLVLTLSRHLLGLRRRLNNKKFQELARDNGIPDFKVLLPDERIAKENISVEQIEALSEELATYPVESENRVVYLPNAALLTLPAQNALLKKLEDSSEDTYFILAISKPRLLLRTVLSRCLSVYLSDTRKNKEIEFEDYLHHISNPKKAKELYTRFTSSLAASSQYGVLLLKDLHRLLTHADFVSFLTEEERLLVLAYAISREYPKITSKILSLCQNPQKLSLDSIFYYAFFIDNEVTTRR